ncbi:MAG: leucine-rich repeat protein [Clostridia bacterium]
MKKTLIFTTILIILLAALLVACDNTTSSNANLPTLNTVEIKRAKSDYVDPDNLLCLEVTEEAGDPRTEEVRITVTFLNKDKMPIISFKVNDDLYNSTNWVADTIGWTTISVLYRPKATSGDFDITVHSIFYRQSNVQKEIKHLSGNTKTVRIAPTFNLSINADAALTPFSNVAEVKFMQSLYEVKSLLDDNAMNRTDFRRESYTFVGWFTEPNGKGERINENGFYEYYEGLTVYAHYGCLYNYDVLTDEHNVEYARILSLTDAGKLRFLFLEMDETVDGYPIRELGAGSMQALNVQNFFTLADSIEVIGDSVFFGLPIKISLGSNVRTIGKNAFSGCTGLSNFFIPSSVREIGDFAFQGTGWATTINNTRVVENMENPGSTTTHNATLFIPKEVEKLGKEVFKNSTFRTVYFMADSSLIEAGEGLFRGSKSLTTLITGATILDRQRIDSAAEGGVTFLPAYAFYDNPALKTIKLTEGIRELGDRVFASTVGLKDLKEINIPVLLKIGDYAFQNCHLNAINFADGSLLESIGDYAFENTKVREVDIKSTALNNYGVSPFYNNWNLRVVVINAISVPAFQRNDRDALQGLNGAKYVKYLVPKASLSEYRRLWVLEGERLWGGIWKEELRVYAREDVYVDIDNNLRIGYEDIGGNDVVANFVIEEYGYYDNAEKTNIVIPAQFDVGGVRKTVREIGKYVTNADIITVNIPNTVYKIRDYAFEGCTRLGNINFGDNINSGEAYNITDIGRFAFKGTALTALYSWDNLRAIGEGAFKECSLLKNVRLIKGTDITVGVSAFENTGLNRLSLGSNVKIINSAAFAYNKTLYYIYMYMETPPTHTGYMLVKPFRGAGMESDSGEEEMGQITDIFLPNAGAKRAFEDDSTYSAYKSKGHYEVLDIYDVENGAENREEWRRQGFEI